MAAPGDLPPDYPLTFTRDAVDRGLTIEGHLLSSGERHTAQRWLNLPPGAGHAYARLISRERQPVRRDSFSIPGVEDVDGALEILELSGFLDREDSVPWRERLHAMKVVELKAVCRARGLPVARNRVELCEQVLGLSVREGPMVLRPRHRALFQRLIRAGNQSHSGDLTAVVLSEMGVQAPAHYAVRTSIGRWKNRSAMLAYEQARRWRFRLPASEDLLADIDAGLQDGSLFETGSLEGLRFSARRQVTAGLTARLRKAEGLYEAGELVPRYRRLVSATDDPTHDAAHRYAMVLERADQGQEAIRVCEAGLGDSAESIRFARTGTRIAKTLGITHAFPPLPRLAHDRTVRLPHRRDGRMWSIDGGPGVSVERAVMTSLRGMARSAIRSENELWTTLFVLIYEPVFFADVSNAWPAPLLGRPADLGTSDFLARRQPHLSAHLAFLDAHGPGAALTEAWHKRYGQRISGVHWHRWELSELVEVVESLGLDALRAVLLPFLKSWRKAARGLPDLLVLPGPPSSVGGEDLHGGLTFVEVKGPGDSIRDAQRWWLDRLRGAGMPRKYGESSQLKVRPR